MGGTALTGGSAALPAVSPADLRPYASFGVLRYTGPDAGKALAELKMFLQASCLQARGSASTELKATGLADGWDQGIVLDDDQLDADAFIYERSTIPSWATTGSVFEETETNLVVLVRKDRLVALHCPKGRVDALQSWLDRSPPPNFARVPAAALETAMLRGEAKGLWLKGIHPRQRTKADAKNLTGSELRDALDLFDDSSFVLTSGRSSVVEDARLVALRGGVGTTPSNSWVWNGPTDSFRQFIRIALDILLLVGEAMTAASSTPLFPELAVRVDSMTGVDSAFDAYFAGPDEAGQLPGVSEELVEAAQLLDGVVIAIEKVNKEKFTLVVGDDGAEVGRLRCLPKYNDGTVSFDIRLDGTPSEPTRAAQIRDAAGTGELLTVHYASGHTVTRGLIGRQQLNHAPFRNWEFWDFNGYDIDREKPQVSDAAAIHAGISGTGDTSLFAWVVANFSDGFITCDDGPNEVADFVQLAPDGTLRLIHVKGASTCSTGRRCSTGAFELVVSQASKNARYLVPAILSDRLNRPAVPPATWHDGRRSSSRKRMLHALKKRPSYAGSEVIIVQPHHRQSVHDAARNAMTQGNETMEVRRVKLIETMLNSARGSITGLGAELRVIGCES